MNILHVTLGFLPATAWGGPVNIVHQNGCELVRRGHRVTVYCTNLLDKRRKIQPGTFERQVDGLRVVYFDAWNIPFWPGTLGPVWLPHLPAVLRTEMPTFDVVHLNGYRNLMNLPVVQAAQRSNKPVVMQPHGAFPIIVNSQGIKRVYDRLLGSRELRSVQAVLALQEQEKKQAESMGFRPEQIEIIPNGLDASRTPGIPPSGAFRQRYNIPYNVPLILYLGRINRKKGVDMLVHAFARLPLPQARLVIAGPDDGQLAEVQRLVRQYDLTARVIFTGLLEGAMLWGAYRDADVFVLPCRTDTFPTTIMEACLAETPMVITEGCEMAHLVRGRIAEVTPFDAEAFSYAMQGLLTDKTLSQAFRQNCAAVMQDTFSITATVDKLEALYSKVIASYAGGD